jgi:hypothetical protein
MVMVTVVLAAGGGSAAAAGVEGVVVGALAYQDQVVDAEVAG